MSTVAFTISANVGRVMWSTTEGRGGFLPTQDTSVTLHAAPTLELVAAVGSDGFALLTVLAALARPDDSGRLVVAGGMDRIRGLLGWGEAKAGRVFTQIATAGFVTREQQAAKAGRFGVTLLVLDPGLYAPDTTAPPKPGSGDKTPGDTAPPQSGSGEPGTGATATRATAPRKPRSGTNTAGHTAPDSTGSGESAPMMNRFDDEPFIIKTTDDDARSARHQAALAVLGFSDAADVVATTDPEVLDRSLEHVLERIGSLTNPGAYLRRVLTNGGVPPTDGSLRDRLAGVLRPTAAASDHPGPRHARPHLDDSAEPATMSAEELTRRLNALDPATRARLEAAAEDDVVAELESLYERTGVRMPSMAVSALRHQQLVERLLGLNSGS